MKKIIKSSKPRSLYLQLMRPMSLFILFQLVIVAILCVWLVIWFTGRDMMRNASDEAECATKELEKYAALPSLIDYWYEHRDTMVKVYDSQPLDLMEAEFRHSYSGMGKLADLSCEIFESLSPEGQELFARIAYGRLSEGFDRIKSSFEPMYLFSYIVKDDKLYFLVTGITENELRISQGGEIWELGVVMDYRHGSWKNLDALIRGDEFAESERYHIDLDSLKEGAMSTRPIYENGKIKAFVSCAESYGDIIHASIIISAALVVLILLTYIIMITWIVNMIKRKVVAPIGKEEAAIRNYMETKNAESTVKALDEIRSGNELETLAVSFSSMIVDLHNHMEHIKKITAEKERIGAELSVARNIQADMLPRDFPEREEFDLFAGMYPAKEVAGDFYDFFFIDEDHLALVIGDVSGKSVPAALFMATSRTVIKNSALTVKGGPANILKYANDALCDGNEENMFVTIWMAIIDIRTGHVVTVNAGHEHPVFKRGDSPYELDVYPHNPSLGIVPGFAKYKEREYDLVPGDCIFVYTDGIPEAQNPDGGFFGSERLVEVLNQTPDLSAGDTIEGMYGNIVDFERGAEQFDDITMLCFRYFGVNQD